MAINEQKVTGRKFRKLVDEAQKLWLRISFWTAASDVEFEDGKNLEEKINELNATINKIVEWAKTVDTDLPYSAEVEVEGEGENHFKFLTSLRSFYEGNATESAEEVGDV